MSEVIQYPITNAKLTKVNNNKEKERLQKLYQEKKILKELEALDDFEGDEFTEEELKEFSYYFKIAEDLFPHYPYDDNFSLEEMIEFTKEVINRKLKEII